MQGNEVLMSERDSHHAVIMIAIIVLDCQSLPMIVNQCQWVSLPINATHYHCQSMPIIATPINENDCQCQSLPMIVTTNNIITGNYWLSVPINAMAMIVTLKQFQWLSLSIRDNDCHCQSIPMIYCQLMPMIATGKKILWDQESIVKDECCRHALINQLRKLYNNE